MAEPPPPLPPAAAPLAPAAEAPAAPAAPAAPQAAPQTAPAAGGQGIDILDLLGAVGRRGDIFMALGVVAILVVLIMPMPRWLLDISLAFSITFSVIILMTALFIQKPLEFTAFPTVLLLATLVRLFLNLASTRLILSRGHEGTDAAGQVIEAFGGFVMGGMIIGVAQNDLTFSVAADTYTRLTVGDGLVTQIPALIVSTSAGMVVTKAGITGATEKALFGQLSDHPKALVLCAFLLVALVVLPGIPALPFLLMAAITGGLAWYVIASRKRQEEELLRQAEVDAEPLPTAEEPISTTLRIDVLRLELGYGLLSLITAPGDGQRLTDQIKALRRQLAADIGFVMPSVRIQDNMQLPANSYVIKVKEISAGQGELRPNMLLIMDPRGEEITVPGEATKEPTFGLPATWIDESNREEAMFRGYTVVDPGTVITTHLTELIKDNMAEMLSYAETQKLLDEMDKEHQKLIADMVPAQISIGGVQRVLQNLLTERISISQPANDPRRRLRGLRPHPQHNADLRARAGPPGPSDQRHEHQRPRVHPPRRLVPGVGAGVQ